jgi:hypothetical protein
LPASVEPGLNERGDWRCVAQPATKNAAVVGEPGTIWYRLRLLAGTGRKAQAPTMSTPTDGAAAR